MNVFADMIADVCSKKKFQQIVIVLFIKGRKLEISFVFITKYNFDATKNIRLNSTHYFIMKSPTKGDIKQISLNHSSDINFENFMNFYKKSTAKPYFFSVNDTTLILENYLNFNNNLNNKT